MLEPDPDPLSALARLVVVLDAVGRSWALVGGLAVSVRGEVRFTRDVDLAVIVADDADAQALIRELRAYRLVAVGTVEQRSTGRLATVRMRDADGMAIDLMFASCGIEHEIVAAATPHPVPGVGVVPIVTREHLIALKVLSVRDARPQDKVDLMGLFAQSADVEIVQDALRKITAVGCNWEQDLLAKLDGLLRELAD